MSTSEAHHEAVRALLERMYGAYRAGDTAALDACTHPAMTYFDAVWPHLVDGRAELEALRARRAADAAAQADAPEARVAEVGLHVSDLTVRAVEGVLIAAYVLTVERQDAAGHPLPDEIDRTTAVLVETDAGLQIIHLHEDVLAS